MDNDVFGLIFVLLAVCIGLAFFAFSVFIWVRIMGKTGHSGWLGLLMFVPIANFVMLLVLAFGEWPVHRELADARSRATAIP